MIALTSPTAGFYAAAVSALLLIGYRTGWAWWWWVLIVWVALGGYVDLVTG